MISEYRNIVAGDMGVCYDYRVTLVDYSDAKITADK